MKIMVFDLHTFFVEGIINIIRGQSDIEVVGVENSKADGDDILSAHKPNIVLMSANFFVERGRDLIHATLATHPEIAFIILAPNENVELLLDAVRCGARGYLHKNMSEVALLKSLYAVERGEIAISRAMTSEIVSEFCKVSKRTLVNETEKLNALTDREMDVLRLLASEASNHEIGRELCISNNTVRVHVHNILEKLQTKNRREAAKFAKRLSISTNGFSSNQKEKEKILKGR